MDDYVKTLLRQWQLEELIPKFEDEEVNEKAFKCLTDDIIRELIPKLGKRAIFNNAYKAYREASAKDEIPLPAMVKQNDYPSPASSPTSTAPVKLESAISNPSDTVPSENDIPFRLETVKLENVGPTIKAPSDDTLFAGDDAPEPPRITFSISALENPSDEDRRTADSLRQFLSTSESFNHLLGKTFLTRSGRNMLVKGIVDYLYATNGPVLSNRLLQSWARAVEQVFHEEISGLYFRETENGSSCGGKLAQYYRQVKQMKGVAESG
ncbi:uncharacterized protein LOC135714375 [Ochlerotatus camptorhynchus]|uniref:uncharacterized protein LOC135714375 n=1 Tax=Ochlerotatus camptorhynchus TaxID=644619 RepID=UPI0031DF5BF0